MRIKLIKIIFAFFSALILLFLIRWQVIDHNYFTLLADQRSKEVDTVGNRGKILASDNTVLAYNTVAWDVFVYKPELEIAEKQTLNLANSQNEKVYRQSRKEFEEKVAAILNIQPQEIDDKLNTSLIYIKILGQVSDELKNTLSKIPSTADPNSYLQGLSFEKTWKRNYPNITLASNILGYIGQDTYGKLTGIHGIEQAWNGDLSPQSGYSKVEVDIFGNPILVGEQNSLDSKNGSDIKLTINSGIQTILEKKLKEGVEKYQAEGAVGIIMNPKTGGIMAMADYPTFDPGNYSKVTDIKLLNNLSISESFEPGSVGKAFTVAAAFDLDAVQPQTVVVPYHSGCINIKDSYASWPICNALRVPATNLTVYGTLKTSDNIGAYNIAKLVGEQNMKDYLQKFGLGTTLNFGLADEQTENYSFSTKWPEVQLATSSFGQSYTMTAMQLADAYSALANHGLRMKPKIVSEVINSEKITKIENKSIVQVVKPEAADLLTDTLSSVFEENSKTSATKTQYEVLKNYKIAGKSGTAQIPKDDGTGYIENLTNSTYIGYDASDARKFVMILKLTKPKVGRFTNQNTMPLWYDTFIEMKDLL